MLFIYVTLAAIGYWEVRAARTSECTRFGNRRLHCARLRFVSWQEHLFPRCSGTFYISSLPFHSVLSEINFHMASKKNGRHSYFVEDIQAWLWIVREFSAEITHSTIQKLTLWQWKVARLTHQPRTGHILDWKTNEPQNISKIIRIFVFDVFIIIFIC